MKGFQCCSAALVPCAVVAGVRLQNEMPSEIWTHQHWISYQLCLYLLEPPTGPVSTPILRSRSLSGLTIRAKFGTKRRYYDTTPMYCLSSRPLVCVFTNLMASYTVPHVQQLLPKEFTLYPQVRLLQTQKHFSHFILRLCRLVTRTLVITSRFNPLVQGTLKCSGWRM